MSENNKEFSLSESSLSAKKESSTISPNLPPATINYFNLLRYFALSPVFSGPAGFFVGRKRFGGSLLWF
jgi:hypothetical protein